MHASRGVFLLTALLRCRDQETFKLILVDEAYLYAMYDATFRDPIRVLQGKFFFKIYTAVHLFAHLLHVVTATVLGSLLELFFKLTHNIVLCKYVYSTEWCFLF